MLEKIQLHFWEIKNIIRNQYHIGNRLYGNLQYIGTFSLLFCYISLGASITFILREQFDIVISIVFNSLIFLLAFWITKRNKDKLKMKAFLSILVITLFTYNILTGYPNAFIILWTLILPMGTILLFGLYYGLIISLYFGLFFIFMFWTPINDIWWSIYPGMFILNFPVLYAACATISILILIHLEKMILLQQSNYHLFKKRLYIEKKRLSEISIQTFLSISNTIDAKDIYTKEHSKRVAIYSCAIAKDLGWKEERIHNLYIMALLHDIGKIGINDTILKKEGHLTNIEYMEMKQHTVIGGEILKDLDLIKNAALGAKYHHERYDGNGYPCQLKEEQIPIEARIIGISDAFDAMNSHRIYRKKCEKPFILEELNRGKGTQFDPHLTDIMIRLYRTEIIGFD